jgi:hypothetical protein
MKKEATSKKKKSCTQSRRNRKPGVEGTGKKKKRKIKIKIMIGENGKKRQEG